MRFTTLKDVAEKADTTVGTVSYVLNDKKGRYISADMRKRVLAAAHELHYIKSSSASALKGKSKHLISLLVPQYANRFFTRMAVSAEHVLEQAGYDLLVSDTDDNPEKEKETIERMIGQRVDGMLLVPTSEGASNTALARAMGLPLVVIDRPLVGEELEYHFVGSDSHRLGYLAAKALLDKGHRSLAYIGWDTSFSQVRRLGGVQDAFRDFGADVSGLLVLSGPLTPEFGLEATKEVIEQHPEVTGIIYGFHLQATSGVTYLAWNQIWIPRDLSVVLVGNPQWASVGANHFTRVDMCEENMGEKAAEVLLSLIGGSLSETKSSRYIQDYRLIEGGSVADLEKGTRHAEK